ncbi:MAG: class II aldolase/adducin family protein [Bacteriovoracia bacterium]
MNSGVITYCQRMDAKGWVANHDGNISLRQGEEFLITPGARAKFDVLKEEDLVVVDAKGQKVRGKGSPFSEFAVHQRIYQARPDVMAVVHAHPPHAMAVGCANQEMLTTAVPEAVVSIGPGVPLVGLCLPNSDALWSELDKLLPHYNVVMVGGNGVFSWGKDLEQAYLRLELVEHLASILLKSLPLGGPKLLASSDVVTLLKKREAAGLALPPDPARPHWFGANLK